MQPILQISALLGLAVTMVTAQATAPYFPDNWNWVNASDYPFNFIPGVGFAIAPINTTLVKEWMKLVNWSAVPDWPVNTRDAEGRFIPTGVNNNTDNPSCNWSLGGIDGCHRDDVVKCPTQGTWGLTFDDGPGRNASLLYDYLESTSQKASLFYIGTHVAQYPALAKRACDAGHHISLHSWSHHMMTTLTNYEVVAELKYNEMIIKEVCGITPKYFRPPLGDIDDRVRIIVKQLGYTVVSWDLDTKDWSNNWPSLPETGATAAQIDEMFVTWTTNSSFVKASTGHISLQHELNNFTIGEGIKNIPVLKKAYNVMPVASCLGDSHPYVENIQYPIIGDVGMSSESATPSAKSSAVGLAVGSTVGSGVGVGRTFLASGAFGGAFALVALIVNTF